MSAEIMPGTLKARIVRTWEDFDQLQDGWDCLCGNDLFQAPFYSWLWQSIWWKHFGQDKSLFVVVVEDAQGQPVGIAPLMKQRRSIRSMPVTELTFAANGITPRSSILVDARTPTADVVRETLRCLAAHRQEWDLATLTNMDASIPSVGAVLDHCRENDLAVIQTRGRASPFVAITGDFESYWSSKFNKKHRHNTRRYLKMLHDRGVYRVIDYTVASDMEEALRLAFQVSERSWKGREGSHMNGTCAREAFYRDVTMSFSEKGRVRIWISFLDSRPVAMEYHITCGKKLHCLINDFDLEYGPLSPGTVLVFRVLEQIHEERRIDELDFGGEAYEYKMRWATGIRSHVSLELFSGRPYSKILYLTKSSVLPGIRRLKKLFSPASISSKDG
jgi:CelD/BcsL family acetyltransferase involved in cellulose biosynthesis